LAFACAVWLSGLLSIVHAQPLEPAPAQAEAAPAPAEAAPAPAEAAPAQEAPSESPAALTARPVVARAKALFAVGDYDAALAEFTRAYELLEGDPRQAAVLNNIAVCHERMFRYDLALEHYARYLRDGAPSAEDRAEVEAIMTSLRDLLGTVRIRCGVHGEVWVGDRNMGKAPLELLVPAGQYVIEVRAKGYEPARHEVRVTARATQELHIHLEPLPQYRGIATAYFWTGAALTGAALITGTIFGIATLSEHDTQSARAERDLTVDPEPTRDLALKADIAFGATAVLGVGTAVLFFLTDWSSPPEEQKSASTALRIHASPHAFALQYEGAL
jgi:tetratricopeptide (TPR) repeat protein